ncbi:MAG: apolipoprotein N-acyltransferase [Pseudomonadota bacterium]
MLAAPIVGAAGACGFQPLGLWPLTLLSLAALIAWTARARRARHATLAGWLWGVGHFSVGNGWIATAFTYQAEMPAWLGWIAVFLLSLFLAAFPALAAAATRKLVGANPPPTAVVLAFAGFWIVSEWLRGWLFTGFPWNPAGAAALGPFARPGLAQGLPWLGTYALSGLVVGLGGVWWLSWQHRARWPAALVGALVPAALLLMPQLTGAPRAGSLPFTLVQPGIQQQDLDDPRQFEAQFQKAAALTVMPSPGRPRLVLWPESGVPDYLRDGYPGWVYAGNTYGGDPRLARTRIAGAIGAESLLLTGAVDLVMQGDTVTAARNVVTAIDGSGAVRAGYVKAHLVPYGEYLPMRGLLTPLGLSRLVPGSLDFQPGPGPRTLDLGAWGQAGVQICYEIVFSGQVVDRSRRPDYIFNPSNDGWFGSWGPPQHLAQARLRAIEEGLPVLRSTTNGISAVIDADGRVRQFLPRPVAGRLDGVVPPARAPTLFARMGNALPLCWAAVLLLAGLLVLRRRPG